MNAASSPIILAIDTSCDETSIAVTSGTQVLSNVVASQAQLHKPYGGVFPTVAKQAHKEQIEPAVAAALKQAGVTINHIEAIAVTQGPGLAPALEVGIRFAKQIAAEHSLPLIPVNHIEGHALSVLAQPKPRNTDKKTADTKLPIFPALAVIVSGGHTEFIKVDAIGQYSRLGWTIDDAAGEALDKIGRMLELGYPAGPVIEKFAKHGDHKKYTFPLPMTTSGDYNLSFSGLKTFARNTIEGLEADGPLSKQVVYDLAASVQYAVFRHICYKLNKVLLDSPDLGQVWLGGGVAANIQLRVMLRQTLREVNAKQNRTLKLLTPYSKKLCGDNAAMIGVVAGMRIAADSQNQDWQQSAKKTSNDTFERIPKMRIDAD